MIQKLTWDSDFFGLKIGEIFFDQPTNLIDAKNFDLLYIKNEKNFDLTIKDFEERFSEVKVIFRKTLTSTTEPIAEKIFSTNSLTFKIDDVYDLAFESGKQSRFFLDKNFAVHKFKDLYRKWVDNSIALIFANDVFLFIDNNKIQGFITYKINNQIATIGLVGVSPDQQGKGIGSKMMHFVENELYSKKIYTLDIPTQQSNAQACAFYTKLGYKQIETTYVKHYWKKNDSI